MKLITKHQCEVCDKLYDAAIEAINCESKGYESPQLDIGQEIYLDQEVTGFKGMYHRWVLRISKIYLDGHIVHYVIDEYNPDSDDWDEERGIICGNEDLKNYSLQ